MYAHAPKETHKWTELCKPRFDHFMCIVSVLDLILPLSHCGQQNLHFNVNHREKTAISSFTLLVLLVTGWGSLINPKFMWILYFLLFWIFSCQIPLVGLYRIKRWRKTSLKCERGVLVSSGSTCLQSEDLLPVLESVRIRCIRAVI